jgi:hypothetical protein
MNSVKNLLIIAVLAAVGYGVYISLVRNNAEPSPPPGVADGWPTVPKVELPSTKASPPPGGPLPLSSLGSTQAPGGTSSQPAALSGLGVGTSAPPFVPSPATSSTSNPPALAPDATRSIPYSSPSVPPSGPLASLGQPTSAEAASTMTLPNAVGRAMGSPAAPPLGQAPDAVRNFVAPPLDMSGTPSGTASPPVTSPVDPVLQTKIAEFMGAVQKSLDEGKLAEAHAALSTLYGNTDLPAAQAKQIGELLDQLAGTVIYSRKHYLESAYKAQQGDTLDRIAQRYNVPWQLLARINGLIPPGASNNDAATKDQPLPLGMELKVVRGPFEAVVHTDRHELTLMLGNRYAGHFPIGLGVDLPKTDGTYTVRDKASIPPPGVSEGGNLSVANNPRSPQGGPWIGLNDRIGIHAASSPQAIGRDDNRGAICVGDRDLQDLYGILSVGSRVRILR